MPRPAQQNQNGLDNLRAQILASGLQVFAAKGLRATKISDIAQHASI
ncbi:TetR family transcriptional regulator [Malonomonas rubra]|nr:TetR family transcriptional regulator [Malonomonas rubra]